MRLKKFYAVSDFVKSASYNVSTGRISFKITVPKNSVVHYEVYPTSVIGQREYGTMLEKITGTVKNNNKNKSCDKTVTITPGYYGTYKIHAYYGWGRATYTDTKCITTYFKGTKYSSKFVWTKEKIKKYNLYKGISIGLKWGGFSLISYACPAIGGALTIADRANGLYAISNDKYDILSCITTQPIAGYSYKFERTSSSSTSGIQEYLRVYNEKNKLVKRIYMGKISYTHILKKF